MVCKTTASALCLLHHLLPLDVRRRYPSYLKCSIFFILKPLCAVKGGQIHRQNKYRLRVDEESWCRTCSGERKRRVVRRKPVHTNVSVDEVGAQQVNSGAVHQRPGRLAQRQRAGPVTQRQPEGKTWRGRLLL